MEEPRKEASQEDKPQQVTAQPSGGAAPSGSKTVQSAEPNEEKKEVVAEVAAKDSKEGEAETKPSSPPDLATSVQTIIGHLKEGLDTIQKATSDATALSTEKVAEINGLKAKFEEQLKSIQAEQPSLISTEHSGPRVAQLSGGLQTYDKELQSILEKLKAVLPAGQSGPTDQKTTIADLAKSLDTIFKDALSAFQSLPPNEPKEVVTEEVKKKEGDEEIPTVNTDGTIAIAPPEEEIFRDRRTLHLTMKSTGSVTIIGKGTDLVENTLIQTDPITQDLLDRVGYVQLTTEACDQGPFTDLVTTKKEGEAEVKEEDKENEQGGENEEDKEDKTRPDPGENGTWFELVVMTPNKEIPAELLKTAEELGPDDISLSQETKDVLIRVLYGGRYIIKSRPKPSDTTQPSTNDSNPNPDAPSTSTEESRQPNVPERRLTQFEGERAEDPSPKLRFKSHHNPLYAQPAQKVMGPIFSKNHELWKYLEVGDTIGVVACARGEKWKNEVTSVEVKFWRHSD